MRFVSLNVYTNFRKILLWRGKGEGEKEREIGEMWQSERLMTNVLGTCYTIFINVLRVPSLYMLCIYVYVYMRVRIRIYICIYVYIYMYIYVYTCEFTYAYTYIYIYLARLVIAEMNNQVTGERETVNQTISDSIIIIIIIVIIIQYHNNIMIIVIKIR